MTNEIGKLATALAKAQGRIQGAKKDSTNPHFKSKYADLASIWDACRQALSENELAVIQSPELLDGLMVMRTTIAHSSGESISGVLPISVPPTATAQQVGSAITYARRYSLASMVGVAPNDDDDGNAASFSPGIKTKFNQPGYAAEINREFDGLKMNSLPGVAKTPAKFWSDSNLDLAPKMPARIERNTPEAVEWQFSEIMKAIEKAPDPTLLAKLQEDNKAWINEHVDKEAIMLAFLKRFQQHESLKS